MSHRELIGNLIKDGYLKTPAIISAFKKIDRIDFVPEDLKHEAYVNAPLPIGFGQTISQPLTVAFMIELLKPDFGQKILDVGAGSGWQSAILADIVGKKGKVITMEILPALADFCASNLEKYKFISEGRVKITVGDANQGLISEAPFDGIIAAASAPQLPQSWKEQLKIGGRIVAPIGMSVYLIEKITENEFRETDFPGFAFVPLVSGGHDVHNHWKKHFTKPDESR